MTQIVTIDFETYYDSSYSLSKISTEEYVRSPKFEVIGVGIKVGDEPTLWYGGDIASDTYLKYVFGKIDWSDKLILCHNTLFDGAILGWRFGVKPMGWLDTLSMGRALHGVEAGGSLKAMAERYKLGAKGTEVFNFIGKRRHAFTPEEMARYGEYCKNDVDLTIALFNAMMEKGFPKKELKLIDLTLQMYIDPVLRLDGGLLQKHLEETQLRKNEFLVNALRAAGDNSMAMQQLLGDDNLRDEIRGKLQSNSKFATLLVNLGISPPMKVSMTTGKPTLALAKSDEAFKALAEHPDERVQALVSARLGTKSTLEESRTQRFIDIGKRGLMPVPLRYYAAHTGRWGGTDSVNLQNLPSRGQNAGKLKNSILAPVDHVFIDADSAQIEARVLAWVAGQTDLVTAFANKEDIYSQMASAIYSKPVNKDDNPLERFVGKTVVLGCGYGLGWAKLQNALKSGSPTVVMTDEEAQHTIQTYRTTYNMIPVLWKQAQKALDAIMADQYMEIGNGCIWVDGANGIRLPSGLYLNYPGLKKILAEDGKQQYVYFTRKGQVKIYGGKVVENFIQAIARCVIGEQMLKIAKRNRVVMTVHDAIGIVTHKDDAQAARAYVEECMRWVPSWAAGLPVNCESGMGESYGSC